VALARRFRTRLLIAAALWAAGLVILVAKASSLDGYTLKAGFYVSAGLLTLGLVSTLAMWPRHLKVVRIDRNGMVRDARGAAGPKGRFLTDP
jgi:hypothetical protein